MAILVDQAISGAGSVSLGGISSVDHATVNLSAHGALVGLHTAGPADSVIRAGFVAFGWSFAAEGGQAAAIYWDPPTWIGFDQEQVTPPLGQRNYTHVRYWLSPGTTGRLLVAGKAAVGLMPGSALQPWDRNPTAWSGQANTGVNGGTGVTVPWTFTVPTGRLLWVSQASIIIRRLTVATTPVAVQGWITLGATTLLYAPLVTNVLGGESRVELEGGPWIFVPASVFASQYQNLDTGGSANVDLRASGFTFDA